MLHGACFSPTGLGGLEVRVQGMVTVQYLQGGLQPYTGSRTHQTQTCKPNKVNFPLPLNQEQCQCKHLINQQPSPVLQGFYVGIPSAIGEREMKQGTLRVEDLRVSDEGVRFGL